MKKDEHRTRMTVDRCNIKYQGCAGTPTAYLDTAKLIFNSILLRKNSKFVSLDIANFYLMTPMREHEHF